MKDNLDGRKGEAWRDEFVSKGTMPAVVRKAFIEAPEIIGELKAAFVISTGAEDRDGDTVNPDGWSLDSYRKNPVVLWAHSMKDLPIARAEEIGLRGGKLKAMTVFPEPGDYPFADQVRKMVKGGFLKGTSVGFHPIEAAPRKGYGKGVAFGKQELYEYSLLPIPSNREALVEAKSAGMDIGIIVKWAEAFLEEARESGVYVPVVSIQKALLAVAPVRIVVPGLPAEDTWDSMVSAVVDEAKASAVAVTKETIAPASKTAETAVEQENTMNISADLFEDITKGTPPWMKEGQKPAPAARPAAGPPAAAAPPPPSDKEPDPNDPNEPAEVAAGEPSEGADPSKAAPAVPAHAAPAASGSDPLMAALVSELEPLKQGGDPTQIATAIKAALEKFAAGFMQQYVVPMAAAGMPAGSVGNQNPATPPPGGASAQADGKPPNPDQEKKGFALSGGGFVSDGEIRDMIASATRSVVAEARMHLTGRLP